MSHLPEMGASFRIEWDSRRRNRRDLKKRIIPARPQLGDWAYPEHPILPHFRPSCPPANDRYGHLESNALIDIEFDEFRQKLKNPPVHTTISPNSSLGRMH